MALPVSQDRAFVPTGSSLQAVSPVPASIPSVEATVDQHLFTNMVRSLFNIDGYLLPELTAEHQREFVRDPVRYFMGTDRAQQNAIFREVMKRQARANPC